MIEVSFFVCLLLEYSRIAVLSNRTFCNDGNDLCNSPQRQLSTCYVAGATHEVSFKFKLNVHSHMWLVPAFGAAQVYLEFLKEGSGHSHLKARVAGWVCWWQVRETS